jgi:predicted lipoprotein
MKKKSAGWVRWVVAAAVLALIAAFCRVTIVWDAPASAGDGADLTVAERYCLDNWDEKMLPAILEKASDAATVLGAAREDLGAAGLAYGTRENETSAWNFCLSGEGVVIDLVNAEKASKTRLAVDLVPEDGAADLLIQWSSVLKTNALRDSVGFLKLDDFANQVEFAELTRAFNARVQQDLITGTDAASLKGKKVAFTGCVALTRFAAAEDAELIPVALTEVG